MNNPANQESVHNFTPDAVTSTTASRSTPQMKRCLDEIGYAQKQKHDLQEKYDVDYEEFCILEDEEGISSALGRARMEQLRLNMNALLHRIQGQDRQMEYWHGQLESIQLRRRVESI
jgi:hypothetical protein